MQLQRTLQFEQMPKEMWAAITDSVRILSKKLILCFDPYRVTVPILIILYVLI